MRINHQITAGSVRLIDASSQQVGVVSLAEARRLASEAELDLVEVAPQAKPPVVRIIDWGKYRYEQDKHLQKSRKNQKQVDVKQIRLGLKTDVHDINVKRRAALRFITQGHKVKVNVRFRGREITHPEIGRKVLESFCEGLAEVADPEQKPVQNGRELSVVLVGKKDAKSEDK